MQIVLATDHAGFELKEYLKGVLLKKGYHVDDVGAHEYQPADDYPDYIALAAQKVSSDPDNVRAIILGGSGQGEAIVANRFPHVRAVVYYGEPSGGDEGGDLIALTRTHNNANILSLGARFLDKHRTEVAILRWLETEYLSEERHVRRISKIENLPKQA